MRRERNKQAAAKCRQKRVDLTNTLQSVSLGVFCTTIVCYLRHSSIVMHQVRSLTCNVFGQLWLTQIEVFCGYWCRKMF